MVVTLVPQRKMCGGCRRLFPMDADHFYRNAGRPDGLSDGCKDCQREGTRSYRARRKANGGKPLGQRKIGDPKVCSTCKVEMPWTLENFYVESRDEDGRIAALSGRCKACTRDHVNWIRSQDPDARRREADRERERMKDPVYRQKRRAYQREYRERVLASPRRHADNLERRRMAARLRRERAGEKLRPVAQITKLPVEVHDGGTLPAGPLLFAIEGWLRDQPERAVEALGIDERQFRDWRSGTWQSVQLDVADRVIVALSLLWWEVWKEGEDGYERAAELFTGEKVAA